MTIHRLFTKDHILFICLFHFSIRISYSEIESRFKMSLLFSFPKFFPISQFIGASFCITVLMIRLLNRMLNEKTVWMSIKEDGARMWLSFIFFSFIDSLVSLILIWSSKWTISWIGRIDYVCNTWCSTFWSASRSINRYTYCECIEMVLKNKYYSILTPNA